MGGLQLDLQLAMPVRPFIIAWFALNAALVSATTGIVHLGAYPGLANPSTIGGTLVVTDVEGTPSPVLRVTGYITGVTPMATAGWHVHVGFTCTTENPSQDIGDHYFPGMNPDPWDSVTYGPADAQGVAEVDKLVRSFSLAGTNPVLGRAIVVHDAQNNRLGCGVIQPLAGEVVAIRNYPGYCAPPLTAALRPLPTHACDG